MVKTIMLLSLVLLLGCIENNRVSKESGQIVSDNFYKRMAETPKFYLLTMDDDKSEFRRVFYLIIGITKPLNELIFTKLTWNDYGHDPEVTQKPGTHLEPTFPYLFGVYHYNKNGEGAHIKFSSSDCQTNDKHNPIGDLIPETTPLFKVTEEEIVIRMDREDLKFKRIPLERVETLMKNAVSKSCKEEII